MITTGIGISAGLTLVLLLVFGIVESINNKFGAGCSVSFVILVATKPSICHAYIKSEVWVLPLLRTRLIIVITRVISR